MAAKTKRYSLWIFEHISASMVRAYKKKDTNSEKECDRWLDKSWYNGASFYREENELNADYLQTFDRN